MEKWGCITTVPFWSSLSSELQRAILDSMTIKTFPEPRQVDLQQLTGAGPGALWVILQGNINILIESIDGRNCRLLRMHEGQGGHSLMALRKLRFYVKASVERGVQIGVVDEELSRELLRRNQYVQHAEAGAERKILEQVVNLVGDLAFFSLRDRLVRCLQEYGRETKTGEIFVTHEELANDLGTSREVVSRLLKDMARDGELSLMRKRIVLNDSIWRHN